MNSFLKVFAYKVSSLVPTLAFLCLFAGVGGSLGAPTALSIPGSLTVIIQPPEAGAQWPVDSGTPHAFRHRAQLPARVAKGYKEWDVSATCLRELQQRGTNHTGCAVAFGRASDSIRNENDEVFEPLPGEMIPHAKNPIDSWFAPETTTQSAEDQPFSLERLVQDASSAFAPQTTAAPLIYAVDDVPDLTQLYTILLEATGYLVRTFNDRAEALTALKADRTKPNLLITDYVNSSMPVDRFVERCLAVHPAIRILVVSGCSRTDARFSRARADRFVQKPFTAAEFLQGVRDALAA